VENGGPVPGARSSTSTPGSGDTRITPLYPAEIWVAAYECSWIVWRVIRHRIGVRDDAGTIDVDELYSAGLEGAAQALARWDPAGGRTKVGWIFTRVYGAVLDEMRRQGTKHGWSRRRGQMFQHLSLEELLEGHLDDDGPPSWAPDGMLEDPIEYEGEQLSFDELVVDLSEREREVLGLRFRDELTHREIGDRFGFSESRSCQIVDVALRKLRERIDLEAV
jgi:RNA polymerase sigma factor (sigma-70 family)